MILARPLGIQKLERCSLLLLCLGCSSDPAEVEDYQGAPAYPNRRAEFSAEGRRLGYVANRSSDSISVIDLDSMTLLGTAPAGRDPVDIDGPCGVVLDPARGIAYAALSYPESVVGSHQAAEGVQPRSSYVQALALHDLRPLGELRVAPLAQALALSRDSSQLLVSHAAPELSVPFTAPLETRRATLGLVRDPWQINEGSAVLRTLTICVAPAAVVYGRNDTRAFVACTGEDSLVVVDTVNPAVLSRVPAGMMNVQQPYALSVDSAGERLLLANQVARTVVSFTASDEPTPIATTTVTGIPSFATFLSDSEYVVATQDPSALVRVDLASGTITGETLYADAECPSPSEARLTPGGRLYLVCENDHFRPGAVVELEPTTLEVKARVSVGLWPERLAILEP